MNATLQSTLIVPSAGQSGCPNREVTPASSGSPETLLVLRAITNTTGRSVTGLLFRITSITEQNGPPSGSHAWLVAASAPGITAVPCPNNLTYQVYGLSLNAPSAATGGGLGSTLSTPQVTPGNPLGAGRHPVGGLRVRRAPGG